MTVFRQTLHLLRFHQEPQSHSSANWAFFPWPANHQEKTTVQAEDLKKKKEPLGSNLPCWELRESVLASLRHEALLVNLFTVSPGR